MCISLIHNLSYDMNVSEIEFMLSIFIDIINSEFLIFTHPTFEFVIGLLCTYQKFRIYISN
jgi:hypothetical protein